MRAHLGGGSLSHTSPVMRAFLSRQREQAAGQTPLLPVELQQLLNGQLGLLWQAACKQADSDTLAMREQADKECDAALARVMQLESELAVLREVMAERDRLLNEVRELRTEVLTVREQIARLSVTSEHLTSHLNETKTELKSAREENRTLQAVLLDLARQDGKGKK